MSRLIATILQIMLWVMSMTTEAGRTGGHPHEQGRRPRRRSHFAS
jgi:hypothetical protein